jgi:hypothetical protein
MAGYDPRRAIHRSNVLRLNRRAYRNQGNRQRRIHSTRMDKEMTDQSINAITITLDDVLGPDGLDGAWNAMVRRLGDSVEAKFLHSDTGKKSFHAVAVDAINDAVSTRIAQKIEQLIAAPIQMTDNYGNPNGNVTTFDQMIGDTISAAMSQKVDSMGRANNSGKTLFQKALSEVAFAGLSEAVRKETRKVNEQAKAAVAQEVAKAIAKSIKG